MYSLPLMPAATLLRPGISHGHYPERPHNPGDWLHKTAHSLAGLVRTARLPGQGFHQTLAAIEKHGRVFAQFNDAYLAEARDLIRRHLHRQGLTPDLTQRVFALVRETAWRTIGMRHFDCQLQGGWIMVHGGLAEMETGEGKTLTATLAAAAAALAGIPVHVITVNDYLVTRDAQLMGPVYQALGLSVGIVTETMDAPARRAAYACDITYCTNKQIAFDYLRDRILLGNDHGRMRLQLERMHDPDARAGRLFLRGLCFALVDEADSVLIDEARTPLIIAQKKNSPEEEQIYLQALSFARQLHRDRDFHLDRAEHRVQLSEQGSAHLASLTRTSPGVWQGCRRGEELVCQALSALYLYDRDRHYLVREDAVLIVDENTGRTMADRSWERGLHQMIEIKENCPVTGRQEHIARLTYQRFFRRYLHLGGMTGTASEVRRELWSTYRLSVSRVLPHKPSRRKDLGKRICAGKTAKWETVVAHIGQMRQQGRPVLVGTGSVADSELLSTLLRQHGLGHQVLNARQDAREAEIIAMAGAKGCITVATNMAGRGTDIKIDEDVARLGGLHVIVTEGNDARRIDRQLIGRCGRQGNPGSHESILSLEDELVQQHLSPRLRRGLDFALRRGGPVAQTLGLFAVRRAQSAREKRNLRLRRDLLQMDEQLGRLLAFSGRME